MTFYRMTLYKYGNWGSSMYFHIKDKDTPLFKSKESAEKWFNNRWNIKNKIGWYDKEYYELEEVNLSDLV